MKNDWYDEAYSPWSVNQWHQFCNFETVTGEVEFVNE